MRLVRMAIIMIMQISAVVAFADETTEISRLDSILRKARQQGDMNKEDEALVLKMTFFYNNEWDDSLKKELPQTMELLKSHKSWKSYYDVWTLLVNLYNFSGDTSAGLKEVNDMYHDAKDRQDRFGMGMAYYAMGNVYSNMYNPDEALSSYQKSVDILMELDSLPVQLSDVFSYYAEELVRTEDFRTLEHVTDLWQKFLTTYYKDEQATFKESEIANRWRYYYMSCAQAALGLGKLERAEEMLNKVKELGAEDEVYIQRLWLYYQAKLYQKQGRYQEALKLNDQSVPECQLDDGLRR